SNAALADAENRGMETGSTPAYCGDGAASTGGGAGSGISNMRRPFSAALWPATGRDARKRINRKRLAALYWRYRPGDLPKKQKPASHAMATHRAAGQGTPAGR